MHGPNRIPRLALVLALGPLVAVAQGRKLNGTLEFSTTDDLERFAPTTAGHVVYSARVQARHQVLSAPLGGAPVVLQDGDASVTDVSSLTSSLDGTRAFWLVSFSGDHVELFGAPLDGSAPATRMHPPMTSLERVWAFHLVPDGSRIVYGARVAELNAHGDTVYRDRLFSVPCDGSQPPVLLSTNSPYTVSFTTPLVLAPTFEVSADSARVVYIGDKNNGHHELYSAPVAGGAAPILLHAPHATGFEVLEFRVSPDGARVAYVADHDTIDVDELYSAPVDGSSLPVKLSGTLPSSVVVQAGMLRIDPSSSHAVYTLRDFLGHRRVCVAPLAGGAAPLVLADAGDQGSHEITPDGARVVYLGSLPASGARLFTVPLDGSAPARELSGTLPPNASVREELAFAADSSRVVYRADAASVGQDELFSVRLDGTELPRRLDPAVSGPHAVHADFRVVADRVLFRRTAARPELYSAPLDGSAPAQRLDATPLDPLGVASGVTDFALDASRRLALYRADQAFAGVLELYRAPVDASTPSTLAVGMRAHFDVSGDVHEFLASPDGTAVLYRADEAQGRDLFVAPLDAPARRTSLGALASPSVTGNWNLAWTPDSRRIVYRNADDSVPEPGRVIELYSVPRDASATPVVLGPEPRTGDVLQYTCTPDGARVVYLYVGDADGLGQLYAAPVDGAAAPLLLTPAGTVAGGVERFQLSRDGVEVVFLGARTAGTSEILRVPTDGSSLPAVLGSTLAPGGDVRDFALSPDGAGVVYSADQDTDEVVELYAVPLGGGAARKLSAPMVAGGGILRFGLSPDASRVVYRADQDTNDVSELYAVPLGGGAVVELSALGASNRDVVFFVIAPDSSRVVYQADQDANERYELYSVPLAGGLPVKVSGPLVSGGGTLDYRVRGGRVVFRADARVDGQVELFRAPLDGSAAPLRLGPPLAPDRDVDGFQLDGDGRWALLTADDRVPGVFELFAAPLDGSAPARRLNAALQSDTPRSLSAAFVPARERVLYRTDQDDPGADELFVTGALGLPPHRAR